MSNVRQPAYYTQAPISIMSGASIASLVFTVALLVITAYSLMGSTPLLILRHDTPLDSRFVRGFFSHYYSVTIFIAGATALSYACADRLVFSSGAAALALAAVALRKTVIPKMDSLRIQIQLNEEGAVLRFRRLHITAILVNLAQLVLIVWALISLSMQVK